MTDFLDMTRAAYDTVAASYHNTLTGLMAEQPWDRAVLGTFAELVGDAGPVADVGCGPGRVTGYLRELGLDVFGIDLSPEMVAVARDAHPGLRFDVGSMTELDLPDGALAGLVAWYSVIHVPPALHPEVFAGFHRVLAPGGHLALGFQVGDERRHITQGYGHEVDLHAYRLPPERIEAQLTEAGFTMTARLVREPVMLSAGFHENVPQAYLVARKP